MSYTRADVASAFTDPRSDTVTQIAKLLRTTPQAVTDLGDTLVRLGLARRLGSGDGEKRIVTYEPMDGKLIGQAYEFIALVKKAGVDVSTELPPGTAAYVTIPLASAS